MNFIFVNLFLGVVLHLFYLFSHLILKSVILSRFSNGRSALSRGNLKSTELK